MQCFLAVARTGDDFNIVFHFEQSGQRPRHHGLIFGDDDPDLIALGACHALSFAERRRRGREANVLRDGFLALVCRCSDPPIASRRSRMPRKPFPSGLSTPLPLSAISSVQTSSRAQLYLAAFSLRVPHDIRHCLAQRESEHGFLSGRQRQLIEFAIHRDAGCFQCLARANQFRSNSFATIAADGFPYIGQGRARGLFHLQHLLLGAQRIAVHQFARQFQPQRDE